MTHRAAARREVAASTCREATVDELVAASRGSLRRGPRSKAASSEPKRGARAMAALEESAFSLLQRHASRIPIVFKPRAPMPSRDLPVEGASTCECHSRWRCASSGSIRRSRSSPCSCSGSAPAPPPRCSPSSMPWCCGRCPIEQPDRLVTLWDTNTEKGLAHDPISPVNFMDYRALPVFKDAAAWWRPGVNLVDPGIGSGARQHHRGQRQPLRRARREAASRRRLPGRRPVLRHQRADLR